ncbi:MAG: helix-hairpin-helix domain-containing protein [Acidobacteria bacterium]|nr:helix-hairpin-helix domain-containing protein [Acidobacteriota bacterium]
MKSHRTGIACILVLSLGMVFGSVSVLAQKAPASTGQAAAAAAKININSATAEQLASLPGIGPSMARSIIEHRSKVGRFQRIEELMNVKGVGEKKFLKIKDRLTV